MRLDQIKKSRQRRKWRARRKIFGTAERPRLSVFRSNRHIYAQIIDDFAGATLVSASTRSKSSSGQSNKKAAAEAVGAALAKEALGVGIKAVSFDRNRYRYHGRIKALADAARKAGLAF
ncbi:MAG: 50S ribosomal protein L18 [Sedimentisphaerales bacterium]|nr:50S ribosomal protein L18 [Sedimentisphaerales bacterium]